MRPRIAIVSLMWIVFLRGGALAVPSLEEAARLALNGGPAAAAAAVEDLRQAGPAGMEALLATCPDGTCRASQEVFDKVCGVRDCPDLRLFWYTDLEAAKAAARASGKPILSLRLMGRLDEEFSCANSRFFRTVFYKNATINKLLRERYVLHWRSVRPVPHVTIDFGDGSRVEQTLTGNSIHYILDAEGRVLTPLPGLYGPAAFQRALLEGESAARTAAALDGQRFPAWAQARHQTRLNALRTTFNSEVKKAMDPPPGAYLHIAPGMLTDRINVGGRESSKSTFEVSMLSRITKVAVDPDEDMISMLANRRRPDIHLDTSSRIFLLRKLDAHDNRQDAVIDNFEATIARDEVINDYRNLPDILKSLIGSIREKGFDLEAFNLEIYKEVFLTPVDDPWLGLVPRDTYGALPAWTRTLAAKP